MFVDSYAAIQEGVTYYAPSALKTAKIYGDGARGRYVSRYEQGAKRVYVRRNRNLSTAFAGCEGINALAGEDIVISPRTPLPICLGWGYLSYPAMRLYIGKWRILIAELWG